MQIVSVPDFIDSIKGITIDDGEVNEDGLHLFLSNGKVLIVVSGVVYLGEIERGTLQ